ncbi:hypothetical protein [Leminorella grimontii]|uniref:hypothetical protein n=1 Tax=Leminorella grimontii TaxID=82981 RepID=UPI0032200F7C
MVKTFSNIMPRSVFCALGNWSSAEFSVLKKAIGQAGFEFDETFSGLEHDDRMPNSFEVSADLVHYSFTEEDLRAIESHGGVAYFLAPRVKRREDLEPMMTKSLIFIKRLFNEFGVTALKAESQGIAHGRSRWVALSESCANAPSRSCLYYAFVRRPIGTEYGLHSCGLHLFGLPDVLYSYDATQESAEDASKNIDSIANIVFKANGNFEDITQEINASELAKRNSRLIECKFYEEDAFLYNPYGYIYVYDE